MSQKPSLPTEIRQSIVTESFELLDKYCATSKRNRAECPRLYARLLWDHFKIRTDHRRLDRELRAATSERAKEDILNSQIMQLRMNYQNEAARLYMLQEAIERRYHDLSDLKKVTSLMTWDDPVRDEFNINYGSPNTLLDKVVGIFDGQDRGDFFDLIDTVNNLVGRLRAKPSENTMYAFVACTGYYLYIEETPAFRTAHIPVCGKVVDLLVLAGAKVDYMVIDKAYDIEIDAQDHQLSEMLYERADQETRATWDAFLADEDEGDVL